MAAGSAWLLPPLGGSGGPESLLETFHGPAPHPRGSDAGRPAEDRLREADPAPGRRSPDSESLGPERPVTATSRLSAGSLRTPIRVSVCATAGHPVTVLCGRVLCHGPLLLAHTRKHMAPELRPFLGDTKCLAFWGRVRLNDLSRQGRRAPRASLTLFQAELLPDKWPPQCDRGLAGSPSPRTARGRRGNQEAKSRRLWHWKGRV